MELRQIKNLLLATYGMESESKLLHPESFSQRVWQHILNQNYVTAESLLANAIKTARGDELSSTSYCAQVPLLLDMAYVQQRLEKPQTFQLYLAQAESIIGTALGYSLDVFCQQVEHFINPKNPAIKAMIDARVGMLTQYTHIPTSNQDIA